MPVTYREILQQTFQDRNFANQAYSLSAFARDLAVPASTLSEILSGKKGISPKRSEVFAKALRLPDWQKQLFCDLVTRDHAKSPQRRLEARQRLDGQEQVQKVHVMNQSATRALTSWIDLAILELTYLQEFKLSASWISKKLAVDSGLAANSLRRLKDAKLLIQEQNNKRWIDASPLLATTDGIPSESIRLFHRSILSLAQKKLDEGLERRTMKAVVFSLSKDAAPKAKRVLDEAIAKIVAIADENYHERTDVYCFSSQLFSLLDNKDES